ncbi:calsequestrin-1-like [Oscarella lobularis]|uniref:calsequestrin-1-like n=1 Tax=Oscarella lobularis TaxID=121494 RepID=UPI0033139114
MRVRFLLIVVLTSCAVICEAQTDGDGFRLPPHDGKKRCLSLNAETFDAAVKKHSFVIVLFYVPPGHPFHPVKDSETAKRQQEQQEMLLETTVQILEKEGVRAATINMVESFVLTKRLGVPAPGNIVVFGKDRVAPHVYYGQRAPEVLIPYVMKMLVSPLTEILGKTQKKNYDDVDQAKVIGYFEKNTKALKDFMKAAQVFQPITPFYVVYDKKLAKSVQLKKSNSLVFDRPYDKRLTLAEPKNIEAIVGFIRNNSREALNKMRLETIHTTWNHGEGQKMFVAFVRPETEAGSQFFSTLKNVARSFTSDNRTHFVWIHPDPFQMLHRTWKQMYGLDVTKSDASFGVIDLIKAECAWYDSEKRLKELQSWIKNVFTGEISMSKVEAISLPREPDEETSHSAGDL